jgi:hypothetical protein
LVRADAAEDGMVAIAVGFIAGLLAVIAVSGVLTYPLTCVGVEVGERIRVLMRLEPGEVPAAAAVGTVDGFALRI